MSPRPQPPGPLHTLAARQRGAALLAAMLTVTLVATLAAGALWQQWRAVEVESAERARVQSSWILTGALDWSRLILREDARRGGPDTLSEPWAIPLQEARLSSFLAADQSNTASDDKDLTEAFLSGAITDQQGRLNLQNLINNKQLSESAHRATSKLFDLLGLPEAQLTTLEQNLLLAPKAQETSAPLPAQRLDQLLTYGLSASTLARLRPYVTLLPERTPVNLNTAPAEVIYASVRTLDMATAQRVVTQRTRTPFKAISDAGALMGDAASQLSEAEHSISSRYFEVLGRLRLGDTRVQERSLVRRTNMEVQTLWRERGQFDTVTSNPTPP